MTIAIQSPVTGPTTVTGLTNPTYTLTSDQAPDANAKAYVVSALGGTQTDVRTHTLSDPFSLTVWKPKVPKALPAKNPITGAYPQVPMNQYMVVVRKGVYIDSADVLKQVTLRLSMDVPAGADAADAINIRAAIACLAGALLTDANDFADMAVTGVM